ncbi:hypothetical protein PLICRDRAFT_191774 [Plicaturopsis crispa FD-325 SS-3]|nr:hypothetical protein PLICRDRAFT_191774 [Plicaturopsis crispa FD-325 SS-3]
MFSLFRSNSGSSKGGDSDASPRRRKTGTADSLRRHVLTKKPRQLALPPPSEPGEEILYVPNPTTRRGSEHGGYSASRSGSIRGEGSHHSGYPEEEPVMPTVHRDNYGSGLHEAFSNAGSSRTGGSRTSRREGSTARDFLDGGNSTRESHRSMRSSHRGESSRRGEGTVRDYPRSGLGSTIHGSTRSARTRGDEGSTYSPRPPIIMAASSHRSDAQSISDNYSLVDHPPPSDIDRNFGAEPSIHEHYAPSSPGSLADEPLHYPYPVDNASSRHAPTISRTHLDYPATSRERGPPSHFPSHRGGYPGTPVSVVRGIVEDDPHERGMGHGSYYQHGGGGSYRGGRSHTSRGSHKQYIVPYGVDVVFEDEYGNEIVRTGPFPEFQGRHLPPEHRAPLIIEDDFGNELYRTGHWGAHHSGSQSSGRTNASYTGSIRDAGIILVDYDGRQIPLGPVAKKRPGDEHPTYRSRTSDVTYQEVIEPNGVRHYYM